VPPVDLSSVTGGAPSEVDEARVLVVGRVGRPPLAVRVAGALRVQAVAREAVLPLPLVFSKYTPWFSSVVLGEESVFLVIDCEKLSFA
jgi:chemotaxis signal transduction protein